MPFKYAPTTAPARSLDNAYITPIRRIPISLSEIKRRRGEIGAARPALFNLVCNKDGEKDICFSVRARARNRVFPVKI
jgi:hypothetical protein